MVKNRLAALETAYNKAAAGQASVRTGLRLAYTLRHYDLNRAKEIAVLVLKEAESHGLLNQQGWAHRLLGLLATQQGDVHTANVHAEQALLIFHKTDDRLGKGAVELLQVLQKRRKGETETALRLLQKNLKIFTAHNAVELSIEAYSAIGGYYASVGNFKKAKEGFQAALQLREDDETSLPEQLLLALLVKSQGDSVAALQQLQRLYSQAITESMTVVACRIIHTIGSINGEIGNYPTALEQLHICLSTCQSQKISPIITDTHNKLCIIYKNIRDYPSALHHGSQSLEGARTLGNRHLECSTLGAIGNIHYPLRELDMALNYYQQALAIAEEINASDLIAIQLENIANVLRDSGDISKALGYYERSMFFNTTINDRIGEGHCKFNIGRLYNDTNEPSIAISYLNPALIIAEETDSTPLLAEIHEELARSWELSESPNWHEQAYFHLKVFLQHNEQIAGQERQREIGRLQEQLASEQWLRQQERLQRNQQELEQELRHTEEKLTLSGIYIANKNQAVSALLERLQHILNHQEISKNIIQTIIAEFSITEHQQDWTEFQEKVETVHQGFLLRLSQRFPNLSSAELRVAALLRTQLSTKEIANLLNVSERAVEKLRLQSRKKMGLAANQNLSVFLANF